MCDQMSERLQKDKDAQTSNETRVILIPLT